MSNKINIFIILKEWQLGGDRTFEKNLIKYLSSFQDFNIKILFVPDCFNKVIDKSYLPKELEPYCIEFAFSDNETRNDIFKKVRDYILKHENVIILSGLYCNFIELAFDERINYVFILHADELFYYYFSNQYRYFIAEFVTVSKIIQNKLLNEYGIKSRLIHYGIDTEKFDKKNILPHEEKLNIVYCGRLVQQQKRILDLLELIKYLDILKIKYEFHIIGDGEYFDLLQKKLQKNNNIVFYGRLNEDSIVNIFNKMDIVVLFSEYEGLPLVLLEAMNSGIVPVVTNFGSGVEEILDEFNSRVVPVGDMYSMAKAIEFYDKNRIVLCQHKKNAQEKARMFSIKHMGEQFKKLFYDIILKKQKSPYFKNYIELYRFLQSPNCLDIALEREKLIINKINNIAIYGFGKAGQMVLEFMEKYGKEPKYIIDDNLSHPLSITFDEFVKKKNDIELIVMGKCQNIYHDLGSLNIDLLKLEVVV